MRHEVTNSSLVPTRVIMQKELFFLEQIFRCSGKWVDFPVYVYEYYVVLIVKSTILVQVLVVSIILLQQLLINFVVGCKTDWLPDDSHC